MQSAHISSIVSSSSNRMYSSRNSMISVSDKSEVREDIRCGSRAEGLVRLYSALNIAGIVFFGLDPFRTFSRLMIDLVSNGDRGGRHQRTHKVSKHSKASA